MRAAMGPTTDKTKSSKPKETDMTQLKKRLKKLFESDQQSVATAKTPLAAKKPLASKKHQTLEANNMKSKATLGNGSAQTNGQSKAPTSKQRQARQKAETAPEKPVMSNGHSKSHASNKKAASPKTVNKNQQSNNAAQIKKPQVGPQPKTNPSSATAKAQSQTRKRTLSATEGANSTSTKNKKPRTQQELANFKTETAYASSVTSEFSAGSSSEDNGNLTGLVPGGNFDCSTSSSEEDSFTVEEEGEEEENYSDFDEDDYEGEEDEYDDDEYSFESSDYDEYADGSSYCFGSSSNDEEYQLPEGVAEDLIIHRGTATKHALKCDDEVTFDSDNEETQIVELSTEVSVRCVEQPRGYAREELLRLCMQKISLSSAAGCCETEVEEVESNTTESECPQLVPIVDEEGFQLYNPDLDYSDMEEILDGDDNDEDADEDDDDDEEMDSLSGYEECTDDDDNSVISIDVNSKYLPAAADSSDGEQQRPATKMQADIISAEHCSFECMQPIGDLGDSSLEEEPLSPVHKVALDLETELVSTAAVVVAAVDEHIITAAGFSECDSLPSAAVQEQRQTEQPDSTLEVEQPDTAALEVEQPDTAALEAEPQLPAFYRRTFENVPPPPVMRSIFCNALDANFVLVLLKDPFHIYGTVRLTLLAGSIEIYGHLPQLGVELEVFSPRGCSMVQLRPTNTAAATNRQQLELALKPLETCFIRADLLSILDNYAAADAVLLLKRNTERKKIVNNFRKYMNENVFPNMNSMQGERALYASESLLRCIISADANEKLLRYAPEWYQLPLQAHSRMLLVGGKSVGKSTLLRFLVNRHLPQHKRMLLIDLDIGQPELFVPQTVSCFVLTQPLLGPGVFLNQQPAKAYMVGHTNVVLCAHAYLRAVKQLLQHCHSQPEYTQLPWLVNTMGYNKGFGLELLSVISELLRPTDIVQLQSNREISNFDAILQPEVLAAVPRSIYAGEEFCTVNEARQPYHLHVLRSAVPQESRYLKDWDMSAKDLRYAATLARLSDALQGNAEWLTDCKPLCAPLDKLKIVNTLSYAGTQDELLHAIEANLVYLCHRSGDDSALECYGIGVVRGIDYHVQQLYLLPAMPYTRISHVNCLAIGDIPLPTSMLTNQGPKVKSVAPFVYNTVEAHATKAVKQIYHRPAEFLTGKPKSLV